MPSKRKSRGSSRSSLPLLVTLGIILGCVGVLTTLMIGIPAPAAKAGGGGRLEGTDDGRIARSGSPADPARLHEGIPSTQVPVDHVGEVETVRDLAVNVVPSAPETSVSGQQSEFMTSRDTPTVREEETGANPADGEHEIESRDSPMGSEVITIISDQEKFADRGHMEESRDSPTRPEVSPVDSTQGSAIDETDDLIMARASSPTEQSIREDSADFSMFWSAPADGLVFVPHADASFPPDTERFLMFDGMYGQLNNQICAYINTLLLGRALNATVVLPPGEVGYDSFEGLYRTHVIDGKKVKKEFYIIGDYFDLDFLNKYQPVVKMSDFLSDPQLVEEAKRQRLVATPTNLRRLSEFEAYDLLEVTQRPETEEKELTTLTPGATLCDKILNIYGNVLQDSKRNGRFISLACGYMDCHRLNCTSEYPYWKTVRRHLQPLEPYRRTVDEYRQSVMGKTIAFHFRLLRQGEADGDDFQGIAGLLMDNVPGEHLDDVRIIYVAYGQGEAKVVEDWQLLRKVEEMFPKAKVQTCREMMNCPVMNGKVLEPERLSTWATELRQTDPSEFAKLFQSNYAAAILDLWMCVQSDFFIGRELSTFSKNVAFWREALEEERRSLPFSFYKDVV